MGWARVPDVRAARPGVRGRVLALPGLTVRPLTAADLDWAEGFLTEALGGRMQARRGELVDVLEGDGCVAVTGGRPVGLITWLVATGRRGADPRKPEFDADGAHVNTAVAEVRSLAVGVTARGNGVGRALLDAAAATLAASGVTHAWLVTTNDNLVALGLYQKAGWRLSALRAGAIDELRRAVKPTLPAIGQHGIPLRDELELSKEL